MLIEPAITVLAATPSVMRTMLAGLPEELITAEDADGWSARDGVAHLASRQEPAITGRIQAILAQPGGPVPDVPAALMDVTQFRTTQFDDLFREYEEGRAKAVALLRHVKPDQLSLSGVHSMLGELSVAEVIHHTAYHDLVHIAQAAQLLARPLEPLRGPMRRFG
jgi:hypothetical protein